MKLTNWVAICALSATALAATTATAATMKTTFTGAVTAGFGPDLARITFGTPVSFSTTYDPDMLLSAPISLGGEGPSLRYTGDIIGELTIGAHVWTFDTTFFVVANNIFDRDGPNLRGDRYSINYSNGTGPTAPFQGAGQISLRYNPNQFADASFPASFPLDNLLPFSPSSFIQSPTDPVTFENTSISFLITGSTTEPVSAVPLPLSGLALITGLGGLGALRRRSRKAA